MAPFLAARKHFTLSGLSFLAIFALCASMFYFSTAHAAQTVTIYPHASDGRVGYVAPTGSGCTSTQWDIAHDLQSATVSNNTSSRSNLIGTGCGGGGTNAINIHRAFFAFDTSSIPDNATILSANLKVFFFVANNYVNDGNDFLAVVEGQQTSATSLVSTDFPKAGNAVDNPVEGSNRNDISSINTTTHTTFALNATGIGWISKTGYTKLAIREGHDILDSWPGYTGGQINTVNGHLVEQTGTSQDPYLEVTYTVPDTAAPTVSLTAPAHGAHLKATTPVSANATDDVSVEGVQFLLDSANLGAEDTTAPYSVSWDTAITSDGSHTLSAVARDAAGNQTTSTGVTVTVDNTAPTAVMTSPLESATVSGSTSVTASATDAIAVAGVQFLLDGANLGAEDTLSPYGITWNTTGGPNGLHTLTAVARDIAGNITASTVVTVTVDNMGSDTTAPTISLTGPASGTYLRSTILVSANATDNVGVEGVQFKLDGANFGAEDTVSPYEIPWDTTTVADGLHTLSAVARDAAGNQTTSAAAVVTVDNTAPTIGILSPLSGSQLFSPNHTAWAKANDNTGVTSVVFSVDTDPLGTPDTTAPYSASISTTSLSDGSHTVEATAFDAAGNATMAQVTVTVNNSTPVSLPNIVLVLSDDQRYDTMQHMPLMNALFGNDSVRFNNAFVSTPLCCPSRASILTGQYSHNTGVLTNAPPLGGAPLFVDTSTIATWLNEVGYETGLFGKYMNEYGLISPHVPPGWDEWHAFADAAFYNYRMNENGTHVNYGSAPADYSTDVIKNKAVNFIQNAPANTPLFLYFSPYAPHGPATPAPQDIGVYSSLPVVHSPAFNEANISDKPSWMQSLPLMNQSQINATDSYYRQTAESLLSVDRAIVDIKNALQAADRWDNTIVIYTSDNGSSYGDHRMGVGATTNQKSCVHENCVRVPLWVRVPGNPPREDSAHLVQNIDFAPTIADWAEFLPPSLVNGMSMAPLLVDENVSGRSNMLLELLATPNPQTPSKIFSAVHSATRKYVEYQNGERELYDLQLDPYELSNVINDPGYASEIPGLQTTLNQLKAQ